MPPLPKVRWLTNMFQPLAEPKNQLLRKKGAVGAFFSSLGSAERYCRAFPTAFKRWKNAANQAMVTAARQLSPMCRL